MGIEKHLNITGTSNVSWKDAVVQAVADASKTIDYLSSVRVIDQTAKIDGKKLSALKVVCDKFDATITTNNGMFVIGNESYLMIAIIVVVLGGYMAVVVCVKVVKRKKQNEMIKKLNQKQDEIIKAKNNNASINYNQINANVQEAKIESAEEQLLRLAKEFERKNKKLYMQFVKNANLSVASSEDEKIILFYMYYNRDKMN